MTMNKQWVESIRHPAARELVTSTGPYNIIVVEYQYHHVREVFADLVEALNPYLRSGVMSRIRYADALIEVEDRRLMVVGIEASRLIGQKIDAVCNGHRLNTPYQTFRDHNGNSPKELV